MNSIKDIVQQYDTIGATRFVGLKIKKQQTFSLPKFYSKLELVMLNLDTNLTNTLIDKPKVNIQFENFSSVAQNAIGQFRTNYCLTGKLDNLSDARQENYALGFFLSFNLLIDEIDQMVEFCKMKNFWRK